jgi:hypothetical protein
MIAGIGFARVDAIVGDLEILSLKFDDADQEHLKPDLTAPQEEKT